MTPFPSLSQATRGSWPSQHIGLGRLGLPQATKCLGVKPTLLSSEGTGTGRTRCRRPPAKYSRNRCLEGPAPPMQSVFAKNRGFKSKHSLRKGRSNLRAKSMEGTSESRLQITHQSVASAAGGAKKQTNTARNEHFERNRYVRRQLTLYGTTYWSLQRSVCVGGG